MICLSPMIRSSRGIILSFRNSSSKQASSSNLTTTTPNTRTTSWKTGNFYAGDNSICPPIHSPPPTLIYKNHTHHNRIPTLTPILPSYAQTRQHFWNRVARQCRIFEKENQVVIAEMGLIRHWSSTHLHIIRLLIRRKGIRRRKSSLGIPWIAYLLLRWFVIRWWPGDSLSSRIQFVGKKGQFDPSFSILTIYNNI